MVIFKFGQSYTLTTDLGTKSSGFFGVGYTMDSLAAGQKDDKYFYNCSQASV